jgi:hypothetical protein
LDRRLGEPQSGSQRDGEVEIIDLKGTRTPTPLSSLCALTLCKQRARSTVSAIYIRAGTAETVAKQSIRT